MSITTGGSASSRRKQVLRLAHEFELTAQDVEKDHGPSVTVPSEAFTMREILEKFTTGLPNNVVVRDGVFDDEDQDFDDIDLEKARELDLAEKQELRELAELRTRELDEKLRTEAREARTTKDGPPTIKEEPPKVSDDGKEKGGQNV